MSSLGVFASATAWKPGGKVMPILRIFTFLFISLTVTSFTLQAQQVDKSIDRLKSESNRLRTVASDPSTPVEVKEVNFRLLEKNRILLKDALVKGIAALEQYKTTMSDLMDSADMTQVNEKIEGLRYDLAQLEPQMKSNIAVSLNKDNSSSSNQVIVPANFIGASPEQRTNTSSSISMSALMKTSTPVNDGAVPQQHVDITSPSSDVTVSTRSIQVVVDPSTGVSSITLDVNGTLVSKPVISNGPLTFDISLRDDVTRIVAFDTYNNSNSSAPRSVTLNSAVATVGDQSEIFDWGRVRGYFTSGVIFSKDRDITSTERNNFSKPDIYLDFTLDKNYFSGNGRKWLFNDVDTFFNVRLTSAPISHAPDTDGTSTARLNARSAVSAESTECNTADCGAFLTSEKVARMEAGVYLPIYTTQWRQISSTVDSDHNKWGNALFVAPLIKGGIQTIVGDRTNSTAEALRFGGDDVYNFYSFGAMIGHLALNRDKRNVAPSLVSWLSLSMGRFENFEYLRPTGTNDADGNPLTTRVRPWRVEALGRLKIPETPFVIGFDGNFGKGPDDLRFMFGLRFDIGKVLRTLKIAQAQGLEQ
jgi:hypothetical protein